jgi:hypothetical protein
MIARDWQRLGLNLLLGPPVAYVIGLGAVCVWLIVVSDGPDGSASWVPSLLFVFIPGITLGYVFGILPALINSVVTSVLERLLKQRVWRMITSVPSGVFSTWIGAGWVLNLGSGQYDSDYLKLLLSVCVPIGGAVASLCCTWLVEHLRERRERREAVA